MTCAHDLRTGLRFLVATGALVLLAIVSGCASFMSVEQATAQAERIARAAQLMPRSVAAGPFRIQTFSRGLDRPAQRVHVYIEGDGRAWRGRFRPPTNPTPSDPVSLELAASDPATSVLYLARPCQFSALDDACDETMWTSDRYSETALRALNDTIDALLATSSERDLVLIGYSGGGVMATLLAATRRDVVALYTLSSPLSVHAWTESMRLSPLTGSLDPSRLDPVSAHALARIPQRHFIGRDDDVVPVRSLERYLASLPKPNRAQLRVLEGIDHRCCWQARWPAIAANMVQSR